MAERSASKRKRFPFHDCEFKIKLMGVDEGVANREDLASAFDELMSWANIKPVGYLGKRNDLVSLPKSGILDLYSAEELQLHTIHAVGTFAVRIGLLWNAPDYFESFPNATKRVDLSLSLEVGHDWKFAESLFLKAVDSFSAYWGELLRLYDTTKLTFCTPDGNHYCVPRLGNANYYGEKYLRYLGGMKVLQDAGFELVRSHRGGVYTKLGERFADPSEFLDRQLAVEEKMDPGRRRFICDVNSDMSEHIR